MSVQRTDLQKVDLATNTSKFYVAMNDPSEGVAVFHWGRMGQAGQTQAVWDPDGRHHVAKVTAKAKSGYTRVGVSDLPTWPHRYAETIEHELSQQVSASTAAEADLGVGAAVTSADQLIQDLTTQPFTAQAGVTYAGLVDTRSKLEDALAELSARVEVAQLLMGRAS